MIGANVYVSELGTGTTSNVYGFYSITVPEGEYTVDVSFVGYKKKTNEISFNESKKFDFRITQTSYNIEEVVVRDEKSRS